MIRYFTIVVINLIILSSSLSVSLFIFLCHSLSLCFALSLSLSLSLFLSLSLCPSLSSSFSLTLCLSLSLLFSSVLQTCVAFRLVIIRNITGSSSSRLPSAPPGCPSSTSVENICVSTGLQFEFYFLRKNGKLIEKNSSDLLKKKFLLFVQYFYFSIFFNFFCHLSFCYHSLVPFLNLSHYFRNPFPAIRFLQSLPCSLSCSLSLPCSLPLSLPFSLLKQLM